MKEYGTEDEDTFTVRATTFHEQLRSGDLEFMQYSSGWRLFCGAVEKGIHLMQGTYFPHGSAEKWK